MATLLKQLARAKQVNKNELIVDIVTVIRKLEKVFVDKNISQIYDDSSDIFGNALGFYSEATEYITTNRALLGQDGEIKQAGEPYTGKDTGDWFKGFYMRVSGDTLFFGSDDPKTDEILKGEHWLSTQFFGLTDDNLKGVIEQSILPLFLSAIRVKLSI